MKIKLLISLAVVATLLVVGFVVLTFVGRRAAEDLLLPRIEDRLDAQLEWDRVSSSVGSLVIEGFKIRVPEIPEVQLDIERFQVDYNPASMFGSDIDVTGFSLEAPSLVFSKLDESTVERLRAYVLRVKGGRAGKALSGSGDDLAPELHVLDGAVTVRRFEETDFLVTALDLDMADDGRFDVRLGRMVTQKSGDQRELLSLGPVSVSGQRAPGPEVYVDRATIEGLVLAWRWGGENGLERLVEMAKGRIDNVPGGDGPSSVRATGVKAANALAGVTEKVHLPEKIALRSSRAEVEFPETKRGPGHKVMVEDLEGDLLFGGGDRLPGFKLMGGLEPGGGELTVTATLDRDQVPQLRVQVFKLRPDKLLKGRLPENIELESTSLLDGDVTLVPGEKGTIDFRGEIEAKGVSLRGKLIADEPIKGLALKTFARGGLELSETMRVIEIDGAKLWMNGVELEYSGRFERQEGRTIAAVDLVLPTTDCDRLRKAVPVPLRDHLEELELTGAISGKARFAVDTENLDELVLELDLDNRCEATGHGVFSLDRLQGAFTHRVELPEDEVYEFRAGPGSGSWAAIETISPYMIAAVMTTEDGGFYHHNGFNLREIRRALIRDLDSGGPRFGASTITMQLARNLFLSRDRTLSRKLQEAILTWYLEQTFSKDEIMALYLNIIEYGPHVFGIRHAVSYYFGRQPDDLSPREAVFLAKLLPSPVRFHENTYEEGELNASWNTRIDRTLKVMYERRALTQAELQRALSEDIIFHRPGDPMPRHRTWPSRPPFLHWGATEALGEEVDRWLEVDAEAELPPPPELDEPW